MLPEKEQKKMAEFLIAETQWSLQTHFQKLVCFSVLSKLRRWIKSKLLTNIHQSLITTCWMLQLSKKIYVAFKEYWNPLKIPYKTNRQKRTTQLSCWHYFMWWYWSKLPTPFYFGIRICFSIFEQLIFPVFLQVSVFHEAQIFSFSKCLFGIEMF